MKGFALIVAVVTIMIASAGCVSRAGPFVTNVSAGPNGTWAVERCTVEYNPWTGGIQTGQCTASAAIGGRGD